VPRPAPKTEPAVDDGRGVLLPEVFHREPGEPAGEYRIVRGLPVAPPPVRAAGPATARRPLGTRETVLVVSQSETPGLPVRRRRDIPMPSTYADRVPRASRPSGVPIRAIGVAGFVLGVALSMTWILGRESDPPRALPTVPARTAIEPPAPEAIAPRPARPAHAARPARPAREPMAPPDRAAPERAPAPPAPAVAARTRVLVSINATPWAVVRVDGREVGETPLAGIPLEPGRHVFEARMPDGTTREQTIDVSAQRRAVVFQ
jgi:hypothetical protein